MTRTSMFSARSAPGRTGISCRGRRSRRSPAPSARSGAAALTSRRAASLLSEREREVLRLVADGLSNKQIARSLGITERTVKFHVTSIFNKLGAENRAQAVALAIQQGLVKL